MRVTIDDFPAVSASRLRALGEVAPAMETAIVAFGEAQFTVGLFHRRFANGGGWSFFVCPCGKRVRILRLHEGALCCCHCLKARGYRYRIELFSHRSRRVPYTRRSFWPGLPLPRRHVFVRGGVRCWTGVLILRVGFGAV
jgi:hypothetical protein